MSRYVNKYHGRLVDSLRLYIDRAELDILTRNREEAKKRLFIATQYADLIIKYIDKESESTRDEFAKLCQKIRRFGKELKMRSF